MTDEPACGEHGDRFMYDGTGEDGAIVVQCVFCLRRERDRLLLQVGQLQKDLASQKEDLWDQIKVFRDHNSELYRQNCEAMDALEMVSKTSTQDLERVKTYAKNILEKIERGVTEKPKCECPTGDKGLIWHEPQCKDLGRGLIVEKRVDETLVHKDCAHGEIMVIHKCAECGEKIEFV